MTGYMLSARKRIIGERLVREIAFLLACLVVLVSSTAFALSPSDLEGMASSSLNPVGSGARATGMGGAFIAVADDATAASWNPAGLINLEKPEVSVVGSYFKRSQSFESSPALGVIGQSDSVDVANLNFASAAYPFQLLDHNVVVSLNYIRQYEMNIRINNGTINLDSAVGPVPTIINFKQSGYVGTISPAVAIQILPNLYFGATINIWNNFAGTSSWSNTLTLQPNIPGAPLSFDNSDFTLSGLNANLGLLYSLGKFKIGVVGKTPFDATLQESHSTNIPGNTLPAQSKITMSMPASFGIGFSYRQSDSLTVAADIYRTLWSDWSILFNNGPVKYNPVTSQPVDEGKPQNTTQVRVGGEYLFIGEKKVIPVRAGFFYDPEPGISKINDFFGFSVGSGISYGPIAFDVSYVYRWGNNLSVLLPDIKSSIEQHTVMASLIYHF